MMVHVHLNNGSARSFLGAATVRPRQDGALEIIEPAKDGAGRLVTRRLAGFAAGSWMYWHQDLDTAGDDDQ